MSETNDRSLIIFGASGHAKVVIDVAKLAGWRVVAILDDDESRWGGNLSGVKVIGGRSELPFLANSGIGHVIVAIGDNRSRATVAAWLLTQGIGFPVLAHPSAVVDSTATIGGGSVVMANAVINADAQIGEHAIINSGASVDHDCLLGTGVHVAPGARLCGDVTVGNLALIGAGASVIPGRHLGEGCVVGAGAVVIRDVPSGATVIGVPAEVAT